MLYRYLVRDNIYGNTKTYYCTEEDAQELAAEYDYTILDSIPDNSVDAVKMHVRLAFHAHFGNPFYMAKSPEEIKLRDFWQEEYEKYENWYMETTNESICDENS